MSNYAAHFDSHDGDRGGDRGGRPNRPGHRIDERGTGRGGGGRYGSASGNSDRKVVKRKAIDFNVPLMKHLSEQMLYRDHRDRPTLEPTADSTRAMPAAIDDVSHNPALGICTKYISLAVNKLKAPITAISWAPDGKKLITGAHTGEFTMWNGIQFNFEGIVAQAHEDPIRCMTWSHNDLLLLSADEGGVVKYWQSTMNNIKAFKAHKEPVRDLSFAPNDMHFVTCSDDQTASIWDLETSKEVVCLKGHGWDVKAAKWHPTKGIIITGSKDQLIKIWDPRQGAGGMNHGRNEHCLADIHAHKNTVNRLAWSPLNPHWFLSGSRDNLVKVFDIRTMKEIQTNRAHKKEITSLTWHPTNERLFASGSHDGAIHQWFVGESDSQAEITGAHDSAVYGLQWHPLGHLLASASNDHTTRFWARNRPGDDMTDKYNVSSLPAAAKAAAMHTLVEAAKMNPSKYSRLPAALAEFAQQGQQEYQEATAKSAYAEANAGASSEFIPGMGSSTGLSYVPGMGAAAAASGVKKEPAAMPAYASSSSSYRDTKPPNYSAGSSSSRDRKRSRSRSRERETSSYRGPGSGPSQVNSQANSRYAPPPQPVAPTPGGGGGRTAFFPPPPQQAPPQNPHNAFFPPAQPVQYQQPPGPQAGFFPPQPQSMPYQQPRGGPMGHMPQQQQQPQQGYPPQRMQQPPHGYPPPPNPHAPQYR